VNDIRFSFDCSFVTPDVTKELQMLIGLRESHKKHDPAGELQYPPLSVFGHADPTGDDDHNKSLSGRRAQAIYALLISRRELGKAVGLWEQIAGAENWGTNQRRAMQNATGLTSAAPSQLIQAYLQKLCPPALQLSPNDFLAQGTDAGGKGDYQGCGEFNPLLIFSAEKQAEFDKAAQNNDQASLQNRNFANAPNRRVGVLLFRPGSQVVSSKWPCPRASEGADGCRKRLWADGDKRRSTHLAGKDRIFETTQDTFACRFYQRLSSASPCERILSVFKIRLFDHYGQPVPGALYQARIGGRDLPPDTADENGEITLHDVAALSVCRIQWSRPLTGETVSFTEEDSSAEGTASETEEEQAEEEPPDGNTVTQDGYGGYEFVSDVFVGIDGGTATDSPNAANPAVSRRLHNLGYSSLRPLADQVRALQRDCGQAETGQVRDIADQIISRHGGCDPPSPGILRTSVLA
jgi:hypothetical protein